MTRLKHSLIAMAIVLAAWFGLTTFAYGLTELAEWVQRATDMGPALAAVIIIGGVMAIIAALIGLGWE